MVYRPIHRFDPPDDLEELSEEGQALVREAESKLNQWIDQNVNRLEAEMSRTLNDVAAGMQAEADALEKDIAVGRERMARIVSDLDRLEADFDVGDGMTLQEAVRATRAVADQVRTALEERENRVRALARAAAEVARKTTIGL